MDALIAVIGLIWAVYSIVEKQKKKKAKAAAWPTEEAGAKAEPAAAGAEPKQKGEWQRMLGELDEALEEDDEDEEDEDEEEKKAPAARAGKHKPAQRAAAKAQPEGARPQAAQPVKQEETMLPERPESVRPVQLAMALAAEGEDPCHEDLFSAPDEPMRPLAWDEEDEAARAQDLLRGVIFAEILTRPADRRRLRMR